MVRRMFLRSVWHVQGLLLWLLQRPSLRWVPVPYPAISDTMQWRQQAESMVANGSLAKRHLTRAQQVGAFTAQNLKDDLAFMEDPLLTGMLAARATKGLASKIRADALLEAQKEAKRLKEEGKLTAAARELIGPRGGLPVLRQDLVRLATLLHVEIAEGDTIAKLKEKCRPACQGAGSQRKAKQIFQRFLSRAKGKISPP
jgi:hypothetical protein